MNIYALKDVKCGFMNPMTFKNDELANRAYKNMLADNQPNLVTMNPEDFELWCLGNYDQDSGIIKSDVRFVASATSIGGQNG